MKYQETAFYARLFYNSEKGPFEVLSGRKKVDRIIKSLPGDTKWYVLQEIKTACAFCLVSSNFFFVGDSFFADSFKDVIIPSLKANTRLKLAQDVAMNHVREKGKP